MSVTKIIECNTEELETVIAVASKASDELHAAIRKLRDCGVKVVYNCDTTELDERVKKIVQESISVKDAG